MGKVAHLHIEMSSEMSSTHRNEKLAIKMVVDDVLVDHGNMTIAQ